MTKEAEEKLFVEKMQGIFRPDEMKVGRLVSRKQGSNRTDFIVEMDKKEIVSIGFGNRQENHADVVMNIAEPIKKFEAIYIPTKEMISTTEHFASLYEEYHIDFEEMYYDLAKLLDKPLSKGANTIEQKAVLSSFEEIMKGQIVQKDRKFYLKVKGEGEFEMGLLSDGYRKLSMLVYLILSGSLNKNAVLFWDEPETNMNPKMIRPIVQAIAELAKMGVQVFVTTHDYFVQQEFNFLAEYPEINDKNLDIRFMSLYRDEDTNELRYEMKKHYLIWNTMQLCRNYFNKFPSSKGVDFLSDTDEYFVFTEVKNCKGDEGNCNWRIHPNNSKVSTSSTSVKVEGRDSLDIEVVQKVAMTLSALAGVGTFGDNKKASKELLDFAEEAFSEEFSSDKKKILVLLFLEGDFGSASKSKKKIMKDLQDSMKAKLRWLKCRVSVVDSDTYNDKVFRIIK